MYAYEDKRYLSVFAAVQFVKISLSLKNNKFTLIAKREISVFEYGKNCLSFSALILPKYGIGIG